MADADTVGYMQIRPGFRSDLRASHCPAGGRALTSSSPSNPYRCERTTVTTYQLGPRASGLPHRMAETESAERVSAKDYSSYWEGLWTGGLQAGQVETKLLPLAF